MGFTIEQMKSVDLHTADRGTLIDANDVNVDIDLPKTERMMNVAKQMGGCLYCFKAGKIIVKIEHSETAAETVDDRIEAWMRAL